MCLQELVWLLYQVVYAMDKQPILMTETAGVSSNGLHTSCQIRKQTNFLGFSYSNRAGFIV